MLKMSSSLIKQPLMSLRSGTAVGVAIDPIIDPRSFRILGWWCRTPGSNVRQVLLTDDVREVMASGLAIDDEAALSQPEDLHRHREVLGIHFQLLGKPVKNKRQKLGKVSDYSYDETSMMVQKLYVARSLVKVFSAEETLIIDRSQIIEVTDQYIMVDDAEAKVTDEEAVPAVEAAPAA